MVYGMAFFIQYSLNKCVSLLFVDWNKKLFYTVSREELNRGLTDQRTIKRTNISISQERLHVLVLSIFS